MSQVKRTIVYILLLSPLFGITANAVSQSDIDAVKSKRDSVSAEIKAQQKIVDQFAAERDTVIDEKMALEQKVALATEQIALYEEEIKLYSEMIADKKIEVEQAKAYEAEQLSKYRVRIRAMEENGTYNILALILNSNSFSSLLSSLDDYGDVMNADQKMYDDLQFARKEHQRIQKEYEEYKADCEIKQAELEKEKAEMELDIEEHQKRLEEIQELINDNQDLLDEIEARWESINKEVESLERIQAAQQATPGSISGSGFVWPCSSTYITSRAGTRIHPILGYAKYHSGVDVGASQGSTLWAAASGTVTKACWYSGYGNCVMIKHDNGYTTLYGHLSSMTVSEGSTVSAGDTIGYVGSTGLSTGPHLHFEIRSGDTCLDPEAFFPAGSFAFSSSCA